MDAEILKGLEIEGLYLAEPHGQLIWEGKKKSVERPDEQTLRGQYILCSGKYAYGVVSVGGSTIIPAKDFDGLFPSHRITVKERNKWWPAVEFLYSHEIMGFDGCDRPVPIVIPNGVRMLMGKVEFQQEVKGDGGENVPYSSMSEVNPALKGIKPPITLAQANLIASWADRIEQAGGAASPWAVAIANFKKTHRVEGGKWVKKTKAMLEEVMESTTEGDIVIVKGAKENSIPEPEVTEPEVETEPQVESEVSDTQNEEGVAEVVVEAVLGVVEESAEVVEEAQVESEPEVKEVEVEKTPEPEVEVVAEKAVWSTAHVNNFPDSSFLYVEPGGSKDEEGKTVPRSKRHFPVKDGGGTVDAAHVRNALARLGQSDTGKGWLSPELRKRLVSKAQGLLQSSQDKKAVKSIAKLFLDGLKEALGVLQVPSTSSAQTYPVVLTKSLSGDPILITRTTNAFKDRESEIFTTESLHALVDSKKDQAIKGTLRYKHMRGTDFADTVYMGVAGRFLIEAHKFQDTPLGHAFKQVFEKYPGGHPVVSPEGWGVSHGFKFGRDDKQGRVYGRFDKIETSVLPAHLAANPYTNVEVVAMDEKSREQLATLVGEALTASTIAGAESETERLEKAGVEHKEVKAGVPEGQAELVKAITDSVGEAYQLTALGEGWKTLVDKMVELDKRLALIEKTDEERLEQKAQEAPRFNAPWSAYRASQADETVSNKTASLQNLGKSLKTIADEMTDKMLQAGGA